MAPKPVILIADDEKGVRTALRLLLQEEYDLVLAEDGLQAVEHVKQCFPDLIVMDIRMPRLNGWWALREIRGLGCSAPVIVITGYADPYDKKKAQHLNVTHYLSKPYDLFRLKEMVARTVKCSGLGGRQPTVKVLFDQDTCL
jgi:two-component system, response regulator, stage 0 sporulation protein F